MLKSVFVRGTAGGSTPDRQPAVTNDITLAWFAFALGVAISLGGIYITIDPEPLVRWSERLASAARRNSRDAARNWRIGFRVMGALMIYSSIDLFKIWLKR